MSDIKYDFNKYIDRRETDSLKWDKVKGMLPMWVADMDIETFPGIKEAIIKRAEHGIYGYTILSESWFESYIYWWKDRHSFEIRKNWLWFVSGVIPAMSSAIRRLSGEGDNIVIQTPVYPAFFGIIKRNKRNVIENKLIYDKTTGSYSIDWENLEESLKIPKTSIMILCNPQNPSGNIWDKETLGRIAALCKECNVTVLADEIHCDIVAPGREYIPFASVSEVAKEISATFVSPTKSFNIAGLQTAAVFIPNPGLRRVITEGIAIDSNEEGNYFAMEAVKAAYTEEGGIWLDQLREHIWNNRRIAEEFIEENIPQLKTVPSNGSYLMWVDCSDVITGSDDFADHLEKTVELMVNSGKAFGGNGDTFVRINLACPVKQLRDALERLHTGVKTYITCKECRADDSK